MIIDEDCLMRGAAHRFLLIKTPLVRKVTGASSESGLFYVYVEKFGELIFALVAVKEKEGFRKLEQCQYFTVHDVDNCHCKVVNPADLDEDIRALQEVLESSHPVSEERNYLRAMSGLDPYRLRIEQDVLKVYDLFKCKYVYVLAEQLKDDYITGKRVERNKDGIFETGKDVNLILIHHKYSLEIYAE